MRKRTDSMQARLMRTEVSGIRVTELPSPLWAGCGCLSCGRQALGTLLSPVSLSVSGGAPVTHTLGSRDVRLTSLRAG